MAKIRCLNESHGGRFAAYHGDCVDVVSQMPDQAKATARAGFDRTVRVDINELNQVDHFAKKGLSQLPELGRARARRARRRAPPVGPRCCP